MNLEGVAIADGGVFLILQAGNSKQVFRIDPATGQGILLTTGENVPGANGVRLSASGGQAALKLIGMLTPQERKLLATHIRNRDDRGRGKDDGRRGGD